MRLALCSAAVSLALVASGCGDDSDGQDNSAVPAPQNNNAEAIPAPQTTTKEQPAKGAGGWTGQAANIYTQSKQICGAFPPEKVARDLEISVNVHSSEGIVSIAEEYAKGYQPQYSQPSFEGCLDGLPNP